MMLATNKEIKSREDVITVAKLYFSRWRIEEYFRCKKTDVPVRKFSGTKAHCNLCVKFLHYLMHGILGTHIHEARDKCP